MTSSASLLTNCNMSSINRIHLLNYSHLILILLAGLYLLSQLVNIVFTVSQDNGDWADIIHNMAAVSRFDHSDLGPALSRIFAVITVYSLLHHYYRWAGPRIWSQSGGKQQSAPAADPAAAESAQFAQASLRFILIWDLVLLANLSLTILWDTVYGGPYELSSVWHHVIERLSGSRSAIPVAGNILLIVSLLPAGLIFSYLTLVGVVGPYIRKGYAACQRKADEKFSARLRQIILKDPRFIRSLAKALDNVSKDEPSYSDDKANDSLEFTPSHRKQWYQTLTWRKKKSTATPDPNTSL